MSIYYLIYSSTPVKELSQKETEHLLQYSRQTNKLKNITGMLLCLDNLYVQLLEGPEENVRNLYKVIQKDARHTNVVVMREGNFDDRIFPDWSMGYDQKKISLNVLGSFPTSDLRVLKLLNLLQS